MVYLSLDGTEEFLDSRKVNSAGINTDLIDMRGDESDLEDRLDNTLPGASRGATDMSKRKYRQEARTKCVRFSPTGRAWAAASTEGLLIYSSDASLIFDPFDLSLDLTPQSVLSTLSSQEYLKALLMSFRLSLPSLTSHVYSSIPPSSVRLLVRQLPPGYLTPLLSVIAQNMDKGPHLEFNLIWCSSVLAVHGRWLRERSGEYAAVLRELRKSVGEAEGAVAKL